MTDARGMGCPLPHPLERRKRKGILNPLSASADPGLQFAGNPQRARTTVARAHLEERGTPLESGRESHLRNRLPLMAVGIIAYGSLVPDPGFEIEAATTALIRDQATPFSVEYAHLSTRRSGAPTLALCDEGARVPCAVIVLDSSVTVQEARNLLFRRETNRVGWALTEDTPRDWISERHDLDQVEVAIHTSFDTDIEPLTAMHLAGLAIASAQGRAGAERRDGISYLAATLELGVSTPLSTLYRDEILARLAAPNLEAAWEVARRTPDATSR